MGERLPAVIEKTSQACPKSEMLDLDMEIEPDALIFLSLGAFSFLVPGRSVLLACFKSSVSAASTSSLHFGHLGSYFSSFFELVEDSSVFLE